MYKDKSILAIITARGGSKGLFKKNIKLLLDKPLIGWTLEQAKASNYIDYIYVSTEDEEIAAISKEYGAQIPFMRPLELALDASSSMDVIVDAIAKFEYLNKKFDYLVLLEPTSPLRKKTDLDFAISSLIDNSNNAESLVSLGEIHLENPVITKIVENNLVRPFFDGLKPITQRQQYPKAYFPYGVAYASLVEGLKERRSFYHEKTMPFLIDRWQNYEIDDIYDFICIEAIMNQFKDLML